MPLNNPEVYRNPETTNPSDNGLVETISREPVKMNKEVMSWLKKLEVAPNAGMTQQADPGTGSQITQLHQSIVAKTKQQLPATRQVFVSGFAKTVADVGRWLSEFALRLIKKNNGEVEFRP